MTAAVKNDFSKGEVWRAIVRMSVPMMVAQTVNVLYSLVDRIYIGHLESASAMALTGIGLSMPIICIVGAFARICGAAAGPLCSIARGKGDIEDAEQIMGNAMMLLLIFSVVLTACGEVFLKPILYLFGGSDATYPAAAAYARVYLVGTLFNMITMGLNSVINAQGFARTGMLTIVLGAAVNIILDPIFIFGMDMGITGAALATVISQFVSALWVMCFLLGKRAILKFRARNLILRWHTVRRILALGSTGFVMNITNGLVYIAYNVQLRAYGGDLFVGAMTIVNSVREVLFMAVSGLTEGAQPVLGFNYGAGLFSRVKKGIRFQVGISVTYAVSAWAVVMLLSEPLVRMFNNDSQMVAATIPALRIYFSGFLFMSMMMAGQSTFLSLGMARKAITFSVLRKVVIVLPLIWLLPGAFGLGTYGVFWSEPISDLIAGVASFLTMYFTVYRRMGEDRPVEAREEQSA